MAPARLPLAPSLSSGVAADAYVPIYFYNRGFFCSIREGKGESKRDVLPFQNLVQCKLNLAIHMLLPLQFCDTFARTHHSAKNRKFGIFF
jgi:hypothetical protein